MKLLGYLIKGSLIPSKVRRRTRGRTRLDNVVKFHLVNWTCFFYNLNGKFLKEHPVKWSKVNEYIGLVAWKNIDIFQEEFNLCENVRPIVCLLFFMF